MSYYGLGFEELLAGIPADSIKEKERRLEQKKHELFLAEHSVYGETEYTRLKQEKLRKEIRTLENELVKEMTEAPLRRQKEEQERIRKQKEDEKWRLKRTQEADRINREKQIEEVNRRRELLAELMQSNTITPLATTKKTIGHSWVHPKSSLILYRMLEVYVKNEEDAEERLIWQGVYHLMKERKDTPNARWPYHHLPVVVHEDERSRKIISDLLKICKRMKYEYAGIDKFMNSEMQTGVMESQLCYDEHTTCRLKPIQYVITANGKDVVNIEVRNCEEMDAGQELEDKKLSYYLSLDKDQVEVEKQRISKVLDRLAEKSQEFPYPDLEIEVVKYYAHLQDLLKESVEKKRTSMLTTSGEKGESNVDYHLRWLGTGYHTVAKDCYRDEKLTILLKKEDFIDEEQELDHIVVSPRGVFLIETKYLKGKIAVKKNGNWVRTEGGEEKGMLSPVAQVDRHHVLVSEILGGLVAEEHIHDIICIAHDNAIIEGEENSPVPVVKADSLVRFIKTEDAKNIGCEYDCETILKRIDSYKVNQK